VSDVAPGVHVGDALVNIHILTQKCCGCCDTNESLRTDPNPIVYLERVYIMSVDKLRKGNASQQSCL
jgi:hypothetical protein